MKRLLQLVLILLVVGGLAIPGSAGELLAFHGSGWRSFVILDDAFVNRLKEHDLIFLRFALQRHFFREFGPLSQETQPPPVVVFQNPSKQHELDQLIQRLSILIREAEQKEQGR